MCYGSRDKDHNGINCELSSFKSRTARTILVLYFRKEVNVGKSSEERLESGRSFGCSDGDW